MKKNPPSLIFQKKKRMGKIVVIENDETFPRKYEISYYS